MRKLSRGGSYFRIKKKGGYAGLVSYLREEVGYNLEVTPDE